MVRPSGGGRAGRPLEGAAGGGPGGDVMGPRSSVGREAGWTPSPSDEFVGGLRTS